MSNHSESEKLEQLKELFQSVTLRSDLIKNFIDREFDGNKAAFGRSLETDSPLHRKTALRWASSEDLSLPKGSKRMLALAQALDIDPLMLVDIPPEIFIQVCRQVSWNMTWGSFHKALSFLNDVLKLTDENWPPPDIAELFDGEWYTFDTIHTATKQSNYFQAIDIQPDYFYDGEGQPVEPRNPQLWYFAFRDIVLEGDNVTPLGYWKPYGVVYYYNQQLIILHFLGMTETLSGIEQLDSFQVETFFGQGKAQFRVASLHPFEAKLVDSNEDTVPRLQFGFP